MASFYDQMKLNVAISSYGGQYWQECWYALMTPNLASINPAYTLCEAAATAPATVPPARLTSAESTPSGLIFLENQNLRACPTTCSTCSITRRRNGARA